MIESEDTTDAIDHRAACEGATARLSPNPAPGADHNGGPPLVTGGWLKDAELAADLGVSVHSVRYRMTWLPHMRVGSKRFYDPVACRAAIIARSQKNEEPRRPGRPRKAA